MDSIIWNKCQEAAKHNPLVAALVEEVENLQQEILTLEAVQCVAITHAQESVQRTNNLVQNIVKEIGA